MPSTYEHTTTVTQSETHEEIKRPSLYDVFLLNDDYTTMEFVVDVLKSIFNKTHIEAVSIMLHVHKNGRGLAGTYIKEIAIEKVNEVIALATKNGFPLKCEAVPKC